MTAPLALNEDDIFRSSSQYRFWCFTPEKLAALRASTNRGTANRVRAVSRKNAEKNGAQVSSDEEVECLSPKEELKLLGFYCASLMKLSDFLEYPTNVKSTAVQYLKRFYLSNSPMTYNPKTIVPTALFLATKSENHYTSLRKFASKLPNTSPEAVKAHEFTFIQGLRFTCDVRHPHRGLEGGFMELQAMIDGKYVPASASKLSPQSIAENMVTVESNGDAKWEPATAALRKRMQAAHQKASIMLKTTALLSDAYFLYTPAQIWLSAFLAADAPLAKFYLQTILASNDAAEAPNSLFDSILAALEGCKALLISKQSDNLDDDELRDLKRIEKKLSKCPNPARVDRESARHPRSKRDSDEAKEDGHAAKKRRVEDDDVFGGALK